MNRLLLILLLVSVISATRCVIKDKSQDEPEVQVIRLGDSSGESEEPEVVTLHIPDNRSKRQSQVRCLSDDECPEGKVCIPYVTCGDKI